MAVIICEHQDTRESRQGGSAKAVMISGTMGRRQNTKKGTRTRLKVSPVITRRRQWDWIGRHQEHAWNTSIANERDVRITAMHTECRRSGRGHIGRAAV